MAKILINTKHYKDNLDCISAHIGSKDKLALVLKDNAYGHGLSSIAPLAHQYGVKNVFVKNIQEARIIEHLFPHITIFYGRFDGPIPTNFHPVVHDIAQLDHIPNNTRVELKVNIGMNRNGINQKDLDTAFEKILKKNCEILGVFGHNGYGDEEGKEFDYSQNCFLDIRGHATRLSEKYSIPTPRFHSLSSSGALRTKDHQDTLVRIGIAAYGYVPYNFPVEIVNKLKPVLSLWAEKIATKHLPKGSKIGYSGTSILQQDEIVSTYDIGYGDGLFRYDGIKKNGTKAKLFTRDGFEILPKTSMDCFSAICSQDEICVFEDVRALCDFFGTIPHEILTNLSSFLPRILV